MSLKGYEFYDDNNKTQAMFLFKYDYLYIYQELTQERLDEIKSYIENNGHEILQVVDKTKND